MNQRFTPYRRGGRLKGDTVTLSHGGGGKAMRDLIDDVFVAAFENPDMGDMEDQARLTLPASAAGGRLAFTTDGFVVDPLFFPGGDIGTLAVNGTMGFTDLRDLLGVTDGNLSAHARRLEDAGYLLCHKSFEGRTPRTEFELTAGGQSLEEVFTRVSTRDVAGLDEATMGEGAA